MMQTPDSRSGQERKPRANLADLISLRRTYSLIAAATCYALVLGSDLEARIALGVTVFIWTLCLTALQADIRSARSISGLPETGRPTTLSQEARHEAVADDQS